MEMVMHLFNDFLNYYYCNIYGFSICICEILPELASCTWQKVVLDSSVCLSLISNNILHCNEKHDQQLVKLKLGNSLSTSITNELTGFL